MKLGPEVVAQIAAFVLDHKHVDLTPALRVEARFRASKAQAELARHRARSDVSRRRFERVLAEGRVRAPGRTVAHTPAAADEHRQDPELYSLYSFVAPKTAASSFPAESAQEDFIFSVQAEDASAFGRCRAHGHRYEKISSSVSTFGRCKRDDRGTPCLFGKLKRPLNLVYTPSAFRASKPAAPALCATLFPPSVERQKTRARLSRAVFFLCRRVAAKCDHETERRKFWSGPACSAPGCALLTARLAEPGVAHFPGLIALLPATIIEARERQTLLLSLCARGHFSGAIQRGGCSCCYVGESGGDY